MPALQFCNCLVGIKLVVLEKGSVHLQKSADMLYTVSYSMLLYRDTKEMM